MLFVLFFVWPGALGLFYSFTDYSGVGEPDFIGLENYAKLFGDDTFYAARPHRALHRARRAGALRVSLRSRCC